MKANEKPQTLTICIISTTGQYIIPRLSIGYHQSLETEEIYPNLDPDIEEETILYQITFKVYGFRTQNISSLIQEYFRYHVLPSLQKVIQETQGDDSYYDYTPDYTQQVYQLLYLAHNAGIINTDDLNSILGNIQSWLWEIYNENPSDCPKYDPEEYSKYSDLCYLKITEE